MRSWSVASRCTIGDVFRYALRRTEGEAAAEDVVAEVFAVAWRRSEEIPGRPASLALWGRPPCHLQPESR